MSSHVETILTYNVANAPIRGFPYPHIYVPDVFPADFYAELQRNIPDPKVMVPIEEARGVKGYKERFVLGLDDKNLQLMPEDKRTFWRNFAGWLLAGRFRDMLLTKFRPVVEQRFRGVPGIQFHDEGLLVEDITKYALGPHSDATRKVITLLFYLPKDESQSHLGTSIYLPKDPKFTCEGGPHYSFENFTRVVTMPFKPNALFAFVKTNNSFHGVEPVLDPDTKRWLLLYDVYARQVQQQQPITWTTSAQPVGVSSFKF
jgi:hypothetical protein